MAETLPIIDLLERLVEDMSTEVDRRSIHGNPLKWSEADGINWAKKKLVAVLAIFKGPRHA